MSLPSVGPADLELPPTEPIDITWMIGAALGEPVSTSVAAGRVEE